MATKKECICLMYAGGIIKDGKSLNARSKTLHTLKQNYDVPEKIEESSIMWIRDDAESLSMDIKSFEKECDISRLDDRLDQYQAGKQKLEKFKNEPKDVNLALEAGSQIYGAVFSKIGDGLIDCR